MENVTTQSAGAARGKRTIPSLDGLRAFSILLVMFAHAQGTRGFPSWIPRAVADHGSLGVQIFFVISGFLITTLLVEEKAETGDISLGLFYARRTLRIFPPLYLYLAVLAITTGIGLMKVPLWRFVLAATSSQSHKGSPQEELRIQLALPVVASVVLAINDNPSHGKRDALTRGLNRTFTSAPRVVNKFWPPTISATLADLNGDGNLDLVFGLTPYREKTRTTASPGDA